MKVLKITKKEASFLLKNAEQKIAEENGHVYIYYTLKKGWAFIPDLEDIQVSEIEISGWDPFLKEMCTYITIMQEHVHNMLF